jgi:hypothetical protein
MNGIQSHLFHLVDECPFYSCFCCLNKWLKLFSLQRNYKESHDFPRNNIVSIMDGKNIEKPFVKGIAWVYQDFRRFKRSWNLMIPWRHIKVLLAFHQGTIGSCFNWDVTMFSPHSSSWSYCMLLFPRRKHNVYFGAPWGEVQGATKHTPNIYWMLIYRDVILFYPWPCLKNYYMSFFPQNS